MARPSSVDRLPEEIRARIAGLRKQGLTINDIIERLAGLEHISRSALGRHTKKIDTVIERVRRAEMMASAIASQASDIDIQTGRVTLQLMQTALFELVTAAEDENGMMLDAKQVSILSRAASDLARAGRQQVEVMEAFKKSQAQKLSQAVDAGDIKPKAAEEAMQILGLLR